jgi:hypothetical protein
MDGFWILSSWLNLAFKHSDENTGAMGVEGQGLMMALQKNKLKEELIKYGINHLEPLVNFALCCGAQFSPMVSTSPLRIIMFLVFGFRSIFICLFSFSSLKFQWNGFYFFHN